MAGFIRFDGVDGECQDKDHKNWSPILTFSQGLHKPGGSATGSTRRRGDVILDDLGISKELDKSSPKLAEAVTQGKVFPKVEIHVTASYDQSGAGRVTYYAYELKNVQVTSYRVGGMVQTDGSQITEELSLNFEAIKVTYTEYDSKGARKGNIEYSWKVEEGEA